MTEVYRKSKRSYFLHFNPGCRYWPTVDYEEVDEKEASKHEYELCAQCRTKAENEMREMANRPAEKLSRLADTLALVTKNSAVSSNLHPVFPHLLAAFPHLRIVSSYLHAVSPYLRVVSSYLHAVSPYLRQSYIASRNCYSIS